MGQSNGANGTMAQHSAFLDACNTQRGSATTTASWTLVSALKYTAYFARQESLQNVVGSYFIGEIHKLANYCLYSRDFNIELKVRDMLEALWSTGVVYFNAEIMICDMLQARLS